MNSLAIPVLNMTVDQAVTGICDEAMRGEAVALVATEYASHVVGDGITDLIAKGLAMLAHQRLAMMRRPSEEDAELASESDLAVGVSPRKANPSRTATLWRSLLAANYEAADGTRKALIAFSLADSTHLRNIAASRADGYARLRDAMEIAVAALAKSKVDVIGDLPAKVQQQIAEELR